MVGKKRVTLYAPSATDSLYPHEGMLLSNTAQVDPEAPDYKAFPAYRNMQAFLCMLSPGKLLGFKCIVIGKIRAIGLTILVHWQNAGLGIPKFAPAFALF